MNLNNSPEKLSPVPVPEQALHNQESKESGIEVEPQSKPSAETKGATEEAIPVQPLSAVLTIKPAVPVKDAYHQRVERVLEDNLTDIYLKMPKESRREFREEGERLAVHLRQMIDSTKIRVRDVMKLVMDWLKMIPGVNRWFLEQEAKIKADKVISLAEEWRKERESL